MEALFQLVVWFFTMYGDGNLSEEGRVMVCELIYEELSFEDIITLRGVTKRSHKKTSKAIIQDYSLSYGKLHKFKEFDAMYVWRLCDVSLASYYNSNAKISLCGDDAWYTPCEGEPILRLSTVYMFSPRKVAIKYTKMWIRKINDEPLLDRYYINNESTRMVGFLQKALRILCNMSERRDYVDTSYSDEEYDDDELDGTEQDNISEYCEIYFAKLLECVRCDWSKVDPTSLFIRHTTLQAKYMNVGTSPEEVDSQLMHGAGYFLVGCFGMPQWLIDQLKRRYERSKGIIRLLEFVEAYHSEGEEYYEATICYI